MTLSERASEIYSTGKSEGMTWGNAMSEAYDDLFAQEMEEEYKDRIVNMVSDTEEAYTGDSVYFEKHENLVVDILQQAESIYKAKNPKRPYSMMYKDLRKWSSNFKDKIKNMVYVSTPKNDTFDDLYRDDDGRVNGTWFDAIDSLMNTLGVSNSKYKEW